MVKYANIECTYKKYNDSQKPSLGIKYIMYKTISFIGSIIIMCFIGTLSHANINTDNLHYISINNIQKTVKPSPEIITLARRVGGKVRVYRAKRR